MRARWAAGRSRSPAWPSYGEGEALELEHLSACVSEHLADGLRAVVDPLLLGEDVRPEEALVEHPFDDLLTRLLRLLLHLVGVGEDLALGRDGVLGDVLPGDPLRARGCDVHRELAPEVVAAAAYVHDHAELVRRRVRVGGDAAAVDCLEAGGSGDSDVLAQLRGQLDAFLFELRRSLDSLGLDEVEHLLA